MHRGHHGRRLGLVVAWRAGCGWRGQLRWTLLAVPGTGAQVHLTVSVTCTFDALGDATAEPIWLVAWRAAAVGAAAPSGVTGGSGHWRPGSVIREQEKVATWLRPSRRTRQLPSYAALRAANYGLAAFGGGRGWRPVSGLQVHLTISVTCTIDPLGDAAGTRLRRIPASSPAWLSRRIRVARNIAGSPPTWSHSLRSLQRFRPHS